jgi:hypothetical protein
MSLLAETSSTSSFLSAGFEFGEFLGRGLAVLETPVEWQRFCDVCECDRRFLAEFVCADGLLCHCTMCLDQRIAPFTRTTTEVE